MSRDFLFACRVLALILAALIFSYSAETSLSSGKVHVGKVVHIADGDTLTLLTQGPLAEIALYS